MLKTIKFKNQKLPIVAIIDNNGLNIIRSEGVVLGAYMPALLIGIGGAENLALLRDFLIEEFPLQKQEDAVTLGPLTPTGQVLVIEELREIVKQLRAELEKGKETWNRQILTMETNHKIKEEELQYQLAFLKDQNTALSEDLDRILKSRTKQGETLKAEKIILENELEETKRILAALIEKVARQRYTVRK